MHPTSDTFKDNARSALADAQLQRALSGLPTGLVAQRTAARAKLPEFEALREIGREIKNHTLAHLDLYLEEYEKNATAAGAHVHWAATAADARRIVLDICRDAGARTVTKGKSMISEEIGLNAHLEAAGMEVVETDLGEYLVQIRREAPSHIIAPAIHLTQDQIEADFRRLHTHLPGNRVLIEPGQLVNEARTVLREKFLAAEVGITGANFLIAETGSSVIVTNEGNGDLTQSLPMVHIVVASIEKVVPTLEDVSAIIRLLARSATGQEISTYTTFSTGPRRPGRSGRPGGLSRRDPGQWPLGHARHTVPGSVALYPVRRLHEPLPSVRGRRRPCLRLGVSGSDRLGADAAIPRRQTGGGPAQRLHVLRALRVRLPDEDPASQPAAPLA